MNPLFEALSRKVLFHFGWNHQKLKAVEELNECAVEIMRSYKGKDNNAEEEIADCFIMLNQMRLAFNTQKVDELIELKMKRVLERVEKDKLAIMNQTLPPPPGELSF